MCAFTLRATLLATAASVSLPAAAAQLLAELPLERGFYVRTDETCKTATNAGTALLRRAGLQWATSHCIFDRIEQTGATTYLVAQSCGDAAHREKATATYEIPNRTSFSFVDSNGWEHAARLCAQRDMPQPWRGLDISNPLD
jgi:hypothetical protein